MEQTSAPHQGDLTWQQVPPDVEAKLLRHLPRVLGVLPLFPLAYGLLTQGGASRGVWMWVVVVICAVMMWGSYTLITHLTIREYQPEERQSLTWHQQLEERISQWCKKGPTNSFPYKLYQIVTASPYPFEAFTLRYRCPDTDGSPRSFDPINDLIHHNSAIRTDDEEEFRESCKIKIDSINNIQLGSGAKEFLVGEESWIRHDGAKRFSFHSTSPKHQILKIPYKVILFPKNSESKKSENDFTRFFDAGEIQIEINPESAPAMDPNTEPTQKHILGRIFQRINECMWVVHYLVNLLLKLRVQFAIVIATVVLFETSQVKDVLLAMVLDNRVIHFWMATLMGILLSILLWLTSRYLLRLFPLIEKRRKGISNLQPGTWTAKGPLRGGSGIFSYKTELFLFWLAWMSLAFFTIVIAREAFAAPGQSWGMYLIKPYLLFAVGAILILLWRFFDQPVSTLTRDFRKLYVQLFILGACLPPLLAVFSRSAQALPDFMGSIAILFWGMSLFLVIGQILYQFSIISSLPLLTLLIIGIYFFGINRINDNHQVRLYRQIVNPSANPELTQADLTVNRHIPHLEDAFGQWILQRREEIERYSKAGRNYPIYVVSSQGGGIYAAYHSAKALAVLSEEVPGFSDHIFAISGVSGGSVGATVFANALRTQATAQDKLSDRIDQYFSNEHDRLAMILSAMLFGNAAQTLFPWPVAAWDRSLGLELSFENRDARNPNIIKLDDPFYLTQDPTLNKTYTQPTVSNQTGGAAPYLVLNTTEVQNGRRYIFSPFRLREGYPKLNQTTSLNNPPSSEHPRMTDADFHEPWIQRPTQMKPLDIRFSTAAGLSARFPVVSPYGFFPGNRFRRLIDGGFYDNSGAITAREIIDSINLVIGLIRDDKDGQLRKPNYFNFTPQEYTTLRNLVAKIKVYPIAIVDQKAVNLDSSYADPEVQERRKQFKWLGWSAIDAVLSTREARLQKAVDQLDHDSPRKRILLRKDFRLEGNPRPVFSIPLGWTLSCQARSFINDQIQPMPRGFNAQDQAWNQDGTPYTLLPCEKKPDNASPSEVINNSGVNREQVRTRADRKIPKLGLESGEPALSLPFWQLIWQLRKDMALPAAKSPSPTPRAGQPSPDAAKATSEAR